MMTSFASDKHQQKLKWVEFAIDNPDHDELSSRQVWGTLFKFGGKSTKPIEDWIVHFLVWFWTVDARGIWAESGLKLVIQSAKNISDAEY